jgi:hypothetical protein
LEVSQPRISKADILCSISGRGLPYILKTVFLHRSGYSSFHFFTAAVEVFFRFETATQNNAEADLIR